MSNNKLVYIASPYAGDVEQNVRFAKAACRYAIEQGQPPLRCICCIRSFWTMVSMRSVK